MDRSSRLVIIVFATAAMAGCREWSTAAPRGESLLKPLTLAADGVDLEIITVRFPISDEELNGTAWNDIDEQQVPPNVRRDLAENGFRAGVMSGQLPPAFARLLTAAADRPTNMSEATARLEQAPAVSRQKMQIHSGWRGEIVASSMYPELPLLMRDDFGLVGHTYPQAHCVFSAKAHALGDRRVKLRLTPELHYGEPRQQWIVEDGMLRPQAGKPKRTFDRLAFDITLDQSQMLLLTTLPSRPGTVGQYYFTDPRDGGLQQKLIVIRLADSRYSDFFAPTPVAQDDSAGHVADIKSR